MPLYSDFYAVCYGNYKEGFLFGAVPSFSGIKNEGIAQA